MARSGVLAPICTPFAADGEVDHEALRRNLGKYIAAGLAGFVVAGSTGEAALLSREERLKLFETARGAAEGKLLLAGTGAESVRETLRLTEAAADLGYDAALVLTPHYYRGQMSRPETQLGFFRAVADASPLPVLIYNFPQMTGVDLPVEAVMRLAEHATIAGIKESSADLEKIGSLRSCLPAEFPVLVGASAKFHDSLQLGVNGGILAIANALPGSALRIYERHQAGDVQAASEAQRQIVDAAGVAPRYGIAGLKYAMDLKGFYGGPARLPLLPLTAQQRAEIEALFRTIES